ncbi:hypothetical protein [Mycobacterium sp. 141]|uniref:hypothetical protein n=1 Tax=Mycobacterium sp. 141 TaxID=1120797 RepID=UPI001E62CE91|nr:hypothetical protein [Mycobacterium sp. 141]
METAYDRTAGKSWHHPVVCAALGNRRLWGEFGRVDARVCPVVSGGFMQETTLETYEADLSPEKHHIAQARMVSLAAGVLVGLRCRRWEDEIVELIEVAQSCRMCPSELAEALVDLASGRQVRNEVDDLQPAFRTARREWGHLLNAAPGRSAPTRSGRTV